MNVDSLSPDCQFPDDASADEQVADLLGLLGKRHTLALLHIFARNRGPWRFMDVQDRIDISPTTLSKRLQELTAAGFLTRVVYDERPPRVEYTATERADALKPVFTALYEWTGDYGSVGEH